MTLAPEGSPSPAPRRIESLDQFRGYTVAAMLVVNFLGGYAVVPGWLKHHNTYCSYPDTIMPQFLFAVGYALRLSLTRRARRDGAFTAYRHAVVRALGLILVGIVVYHLDGTYKSFREIEARGFATVLLSGFARSPFQALVHIGVTTLWVLPVILLGNGARLAFALGSAVLHVALSGWFYYDWLQAIPVIDGGPLGFLTWSLPTLAGAWAYDVVSELGPSKSLSRLLAGAAVLMALGYGLSCLDRGGIWAEPPFVPPVTTPGFWSMSQRAGSVSYLTFGAGFSLAVLSLFVVMSDLGSVRLGLFRTFGRNALAAYLIHMFVARAVKPLVPGDSPVWYVLVGFGTYYAISYAFVRYLEKSGIELKL